MSEEFELHSVGNGKQLNNCVCDTKKMKAGARSLVVPGRIVGRCATTGTPRRFLKTTRRTFCIELS